MYELFALFAATKVAPVRMDCEFYV